MGFTQIANHRTKDAQLWRQGGINLIANYEPKSAAWYFAREHGPSACGMGFRVKNAVKSYEYLLAQGAEPVAVEPVEEVPAEPAPVDITTPVSETETTEEATPVETAPPLNFSISKNEKIIVLSFLARV